MQNVLLKILINNVQLFFSHCVQLPEIISNSNFQLQTTWMAFCKGCVITCSSDKAQPWNGVKIKLFLQTNVNLDRLNQF